MGKHLATRNDEAGDENTIKGKHGLKRKGMSDSVDTLYMLKQERKQARHEARKQVNRERRQARKQARKQAVAKNTR